MIAEFGDQIRKSNANTIMRMLSLNVLRDDCKPPLESFDYLVDEEVVKEVMDFMPEPSKIDFVADERQNYPPLSKKLVTSKSCLGAPYFIHKQHRVSTDPSSQSASLQTKASFTRSLSVVVALSYLRSFRPVQMRVAFESVRCGVLALNGA
ncbi:hypothetical protein C8Q74DRAFT_1369096 [Fomes fomentarius]|nr:hypothetical protein C8Q74DRAFT_1369096 [Fomes fomentarius]